jgi:hypothetical protein
MISLIVPTRQRTDQLANLLRSVAATAANPEALEVVLVVDADDGDSIGFEFPRLPLKRVVVAPGRPMGALNMAGYEAAAGEYLMLLNDDVVARTWKWDRKIRACFRRFPDGLVLVHPNDTVFQDKLCTFPVVSRTFCTLAGGICPRAYLRYRIDDHIEDIFNLLGALGERRTVYLPEVIFEHANFALNVHGVREYFSDENILALDAPLFEALFPARKELALRLKQRLVPRAGPAEQERWRTRLETVRDPFALRVGGRQRVAAGVGYWLRTWAETTGRTFFANFQRLRNGLRHKGVCGLVRALWRRFPRGSWETPTPNST